MNATVRVFDSFAAAEAADDEYYASLSPQERVTILLELIADHEEALGEAAKGFARVHRVVDLECS